MERGGKDMEPVLRIRQELRQAARQVAAVKDPDMALLFCYIAASGGSFTAGS